MDPIWNRFNSALTREGYDKARAQDKEILSQAPKGYRKYMSMEATAQRVVRLLEEYPDGLTSVDVAETLALHRCYAGELLIFLLDQGRVKRLGRGGKHDPYQWSLAAAE